VFGWLIDGHVLAPLSVVIVPYPTNTVSEAGLKQPSFLIDMKVVTLWEFAKSENERGKVEE